MKAPTRLLMTTDTVGGVWRYSMTLAAALERKGWDVRLAAFGPAPDAAQRAEVDALAGVSLVATELPLDWAGSNRPAMEAAGAMLADLAARERCDLAHLNTPLLAAAGNWRMPVIGVMHGCVATWWAKARKEELPPELAWHRDMTLQGLAACDRVIAPSFAFADDIAAVYGIDRPIEIIYNGSAPHLPVGLVPNKPFAFTAGRLWDDVKNTAVLDEVAGKLDAPFYAAGSNEGPQGQHVPTRHLRLLGQLSAREIRSRLASRPVFVSAALFEPFGLAVLEAAQAGCPLVLSDIPSFRELWGGAAIFVNPRDVHGFTREIEVLLRNAELRQRLGTSARCRAMDYSVRAMIEGTIAQYEGVLQQCEVA